MKIFFATSFLLLISLSLHSQVDRTNFRAGLNVGMVTGEISELYSFSLGLDMLYVWGLSKEIDLGIATGFNNAFGEDETLSQGGTTVSTEFANIQYIPAAVALRIYPSYGFKLGGDFGYAIGLSDGFDGGLYYKPMIGVDINGTTELNVSYAAINNNGTFATAMIGVLFLF